jgi:hypothetical protein
MILKVILVRVQKLTYSIAQVFRLPTALNAIKLLKFSVYISLTVFKTKCVLNKEIHSIAAQFIVHAFGQKIVLCSFVL